MRWKGTSCVFIPHRRAQSRHRGPGTWAGVPRDGAGAGTTAGRSEPRSRGAPALGAAVVPGGAAGTERSAVEDPGGVGKRARGYHGNRQGVVLSPPIGSRQAYNEESRVKRRGCMDSTSDQQAAPEALLVGRTPTGRWVKGESGGKWTGMAALAVTIRIASPWLDGYAAADVCSHGPCSGRKSSPNPFHPRREGPGRRAYLLHEVGPSISTT